MRVVASALAFLLTGASPALACTCGCDKARLLENTAVFFIGRPLTVKTVAGRLHYDVEVVSVIRGELPTRVVVTSPAGGGACRVSYDLRKDVLIGARREANELQTNLCTDLCVRQNREAIEALEGR
jgi:hypothetical protein